MPKRWIAALHTLLGIIQPFLGALAKAASQRPWSNSRAGIFGIRREWPQQNPELRSYRHTRGQCSQSRPYPGRQVEIPYLTLQGFGMVKQPRPWHVRKLRVSGEPGRASSRHTFQTGHFLALGSKNNRHGGAKIAPILFFKVGSNEDPFGKSIPHASQSLYKPCGNAPIRQPDYGVPPVFCQESGYCCCPGLKHGHGKSG